MIPLHFTQILLVLEVLDNEEFIKTMKISRRTAQTWRDEGKISFSQVGNKIYYKLSDVEKTMQDHYNKSFAKK